METAIQLNTDTVRQKISDRIKASFVELIPEETWQIIVKAEIHTFVTEESPRYYSSSNPTPSPLRTLIRDALAKMFEAKLKDELSKPEYADRWGQYGAEPSEVVKRIVAEMGPQLWEAAVGGVVQTMLSRLRQGS